MNGRCTIVIKLAMPLFTINEPKAIQKRFALFRLGFRPFFLLGPLFSILSLTYFIAWMSGVVTFWPSAWDAVIWHRHEMLFGYTGAIIAGFLLTAVPNWTGHPTPKGIGLVALAGVWLLGRVCVFFSSHIPAPLVMAMDSAFFLLCALSILPALVKARNVRNYMFIVLLAGLSASNLLTHTYSEEDAELADTGINTALNIIILIMVIIGGRVIPFFTERGLSVTVKRSAALDKTAMTLTLAALSADIALSESRITGIFFMLAAIANGIRLAGWKTPHTLKVPLLWVLHVGFGWIIIGLAIKGLHILGYAVPSIVATHAFTTGGIGTLTLGMMARVSLGHTGRPLAVGKFMAVAFLLVTFSALCRVLGIWLMPAFIMPLLELSALCWIGAFIIFTFTYFPILLYSRIDGRDG